MDIGIIGAGVIGLSTALVLAEAGYRVTIVARELPGDKSLLWASPWAGAGILPYPTSQGQDLQAATYKYFWSLAETDPSSGVQRFPVREYFDDRDNDDSCIWYRSLVNDYQRLPGPLLGFAYQSTTVNPDVYLPWLQEQLAARSVKFLRHSVESLAAARSLTGAQLLINASGLGASSLADDPEVRSIRGQTLLVKGETAAALSREMVLFQGSKYAYCIPRAGSGDVVLGGVAQPGDIRATPDVAARRQIVAGIKTLVQDIGSISSIAEADESGVDRVEDIVAFRPGRDGGYRLEKDSNTIHAYGFGGLGYTYSHGVALRVLEMAHMFYGECASTRG